MAWTAIYEMFRQNLDGDGQFDDWGGPAVQSITGTGINVLEPDGRHIADGTMSVTLSGGMQEAVMDPTLTQGTAKRELTAIDLAFLEDMGYSVVPEPSTYAMIFGVLATGLFFLRRWKN